jgi:hypothetical protein
VKSIFEGGGIHAGSIQTVGMGGDQSLDSRRSRREIGWEILNDCAKISRETERSR